ncbi:MAG TPA: type 4a pilus biogenesis protein PilO [Candidatus Binatia bacterium]|nr:type 4a pilus biogenesis protein PilO [Candidatus Binatia bacterium]
MTWPAFLEPLISAPRWQKVVLGVLGLAILGAGTYFLLLSPLEIRVGGLRSQQASLQREVIAARAAANEVNRTRREIAELTAKLDVLKDRLPTEKEMPALFRSVTDAAYQAGLQVALFQPREGRIRDYYVEIPIGLTAESGYHQLGEFFEKVSRLPRLVNVAEIKVSGLSKGPAPLRAELTLATYQYRPVGSPPAPKTGQPEAKK